MGLRLSFFFWIKFVVGVEMSKSWYVLNSYSGYENKAKEQLIERINLHGMDDFFGKIEVPAEEITEMKAGKEKTVQKKFFPGYILVEMEMNDDTWHLERGQVLSKPGSITPHTKFEAQVYVLNKEEGGRHTPFFKGYRPQFYVRTTDVTGEVILPEGVEMVMPGDDVAINVDLISPIAMEEGMRFAIREGGRTVGSGVVSKIVE